VLAVMADRDEWEGTPTELYGALTPHAPVPAPRDWPKAANILTGRLRRLAPNLRRVHRIDFDTARATDSTRRRIVRLRRLPVDAGDRPSEPSGPAAGHNSTAHVPDGTADATGGADVGPSGPQRPGGWGSDDPDDADGFRSGAEEVSAREYARFLDLH